MDGLLWRLVDQIQYKQTKQQQVTVLTPIGVIAGTPVSAETFRETLQKIYQIPKVSLDTPQSDRDFLHLTGAQIVMGSGVHITLPPDVLLRVEYSHIIGFLPGYLAKTEGATDVTPNTTTTPDADGVTEAGTGTSDA